jgi:hypothetical protein
MSTAPVVGEADRPLTAAEVLVYPPDLVQSRQGTPFPRPARISLAQSRDLYTPDEARDLAKRLGRAAEHAERADELLLPTLQRHCAELHSFLDTEDSA